MEKARLCGRVGMAARLIIESHVNTLGTFQVVVLHRSAKNWERVWKPTASWMVGWLRHTDCTIIG